MVMRCYLAPHQHAAPLPRNGGQRLALINHAVIVSTVKDPFIPGRLFDKQGVGYRGNRPGCAHNYQRALDARLQLIDSLQTSARQRLERAYRCHLTIMHLAYAAHNQFLMLSPLAIFRDSFPNPYDQAAQRWKRRQKALDLWLIPAVPAICFATLLYTQCHIQK